MTKASLIRTLLWLLPLLLPLSIQAQNQTVTLSGKNLTLQAAFEQIEQQTNLSIDYDANTIDVNRKIQTVPSTGQVSSVLKQILHETGYAYRFNRSHVIITLPPTIEEAEANKNQTIDVSGKIVDRLGEAIIGANVVIAGSSVGTISDTNGEFNISVPQSGTLQITYIGYETKEVKVRGNSFLEITLFEDANRWTN